MGKGSNDADAEKKTSGDPSSDEDLVKKMRRAQKLWLELKQVRAQILVLRLMSRRLSVKKKSSLKGG